MLNRMFQVFLFVTVLGGFFFVFAGRNDEGNVWRQFRQMNPDTQVKKLRESSLAQVDAQWKETMEKFREVDQDQQLMLAGLNKNARDLAGNLMEMADVQTFLFASLTGRGPEGDSKRFLENFQLQSNMAADLGNITNLNHEEILNRIQLLQEQQHGILESRQDEYEEAIKHYQRLQKEQQVLAESSQRIIEQQQGLLAQNLQENSQDRLQTAIHNQTQILDQQNQVQAMQNDNFKITMQLYKQLQDQHRSFTESISSDLQSPHVESKGRLEQLLDDQRSFLDDKQHHFRTLFDQQQQLQRLRKRLFDDFIRSVELNKQWMADHREQIQRQQEAFIDNRRDNFEQIMEDQKFRTQQLKEQRDFAIERMKEQQKVFREMQEHHQQLLKAKENL